MPTEPTPIPAAVVDAVTADLNRALGMRIVHRNSVAAALANAAPALRAAGRTAAAADIRASRTEMLKVLKGPRLSDAEVQSMALRSAALDAAARVAENGADRRRCYCDAGPGGGGALTGHDVGTGANCRAGADQ